MAPFLRRGRSSASNKKDAAANNQPPPPPPDSSYAPPPPDASSGLPPPPVQSGGGAAAYTASSSSNTFGHRIRLATRGDGLKKVIASDASLSEADKAVDAILRSTQSLSRVLAANDGAYASLAENHRGFRSALMEVYQEGDPARAVLDTFAQKSGVLSALDAEGSPMAEPRAESTRALNALLGRIDGLQKLHVNRAELKRDLQYYTEKVNNLRAAEERKGVKNEKEVEKRQRNEQKRDELAGQLQHATGRFYADAHQVFAERAITVDKVVKSYVLVQHHFLGPMTGMDSVLREAQIGIRTVAGTVPAPQNPDVTGTVNPTDSMASMLTSTSDLYMSASDQPPPPPPPGPGMSPPPAPPGHGFPPPPPGHGMPPPPPPGGPVPSAPVPPSGPPDSYGNASGMPRYTTGDSHLPPPPPPPPGTGGHGLDANLSGGSSGTEAPPPVPSVQSPGIYGGPTHGKWDNALPPPPPPPSAPTAHGYGAHPTDLPPPPPPPPSTYLD